MRNKKMNILVLLTALLIMIFVTGCGDSKTAEVKEYAKTIDELTIPEGTEIVAFGEATHGNSDFQELKTEIFKKLVESGEVKSFCLEGHSGCYLTVNDYINGGETTLDEAMDALNFRIYKTETSEELLKWMREYNLEQGAGNRLNFYGYDMQDDEPYIDYLTKKAGIDGSMFDKVSIDDVSLTLNEKLDKIGLIRAELEKMADDPSIDYEEATHMLRCLEQCVILFDAYVNNAGESYKLRDGYMAENVEWILEREQELGRNMIFVTGHAGHISKLPQSPMYQNNNMGCLLESEHPTGYYVIGSDFYRTTANLPNSKGERGKHSFKSDDGFAKSAKDFGGRYLLQFDDVDTASTLYAELGEDVSMGSLGESYSVLMHIIKRTHIVNAAPLDCYDAMVFVYDAEPLKLK